ncbi:NAD(P)H-binding protein [Ktedonospora formicarum]|uniref:NAD(P)H-binding protein n=1 Tax=Ktedonospora formicarum TaxID=2778364 RepID=UPI001C68E7C7|nr:NAD(P)H-binding protein [Ktedonospora formicarum]
MSEQMREAMLAVLLVSSQVPNGERIFLNVMKGQLMKRAFVTGATGLLGSNLIMQLLDEGYAVRALVRSIEKGKRQFPDPRVELIVGDMLNVSAFAASLEGVDILFHAAAYFRESFGSGDHEAQLERINVCGTIELLDAAYGKGITNVVYVSALSVLQRPSDGSPFDEHSPTM